MFKQNILICDYCLNRNFHFKKHNRNERLILRKYCPKCKKHIMHKETR
ncbi:50S ribosomal protein L33 [Candidatus Phytoplasma pini]|nr:50S ribosomal protein L33 [Candidatus Phytoplasma pini]